jgi:natural product precursor
MKAKKMKKLTFNKNTIADLSQKRMSVLNGGVLTNPTSFALPGGTTCELPCGNETDSCVPRDCVQPTTDPTIGPGVCDFC